MAKNLQRGPASRKELEIIKTSSLPPEELAKKLRRSVNFVKKHMAAKPVLVQLDENQDWVARLHASPFWPQHKKQLIATDGEVAFFEQTWAAYMDQFGSASDILATDELMVRDLIMLDIMSNRAIVEQADCIRLIDQFQKFIDDEMKKEDEDRDQMQLANWRTNLNSNIALKTTLSKQHLDLQNRKDAKLKDLKGSRDQRFKQIEESRRNIFELIKDLDSHKRRLEEGKLAEKVRIAADSVAHDWNQVMEFEDGEVDKPFLSPEGEMEDARLQNEQE